MGDVLNYRYVIGSTSVWWFWGSGEDDINVLDLVLMAMGMAGGTYHPGAKPAGVTPPSFV